MDDFLAVEGAILERLEAKIEGIAAFGSLLEYSALAQQSMVFPSVYVGFGGYTPVNDPKANGAIQRVRQFWKVMVMVHDSSDTDGSKLRADAGPILSAALKWLMGWRPMDGVEPLNLADAPEPEYGGGTGQFYLAFSCNVTCKGDVAG